MAVGDTVAARRLRRAPARRRAKCRGPNYVGAARRRSSCRRTAGCCARSHPEKRAYFSSRDADDRDRDRHRPRRATSTSRSASASAARQRRRGACASTTSPSSIWIWGGCLLMALGGALRRGRPALSRCSKPRCAAQGAPRHEALPDPARRSSSRWSVFLAVGLTRDPREVPSPLVGRPAPAFDAAASRRRRAPSRPLLAGRHAGQGLDAQRLGLVVRVVPPGASGAARIARRGVVPLVGLDYKDARRRARALARRSTAIRTCCRRSTPTAASASTTASTACPRPTSSTRPA